MKTRDSHLLRGRDRNVSRCCRIARQVFCQSMSEHGTRFHPIPQIRFVSSERCQIVVALPWCSLAERRSQARTEVARGQARVSEAWAYELSEIVFVFET